MGVQKLNGKEYILQFTRRWKMLGWLELLCYALAVALLGAVLTWLLSGSLQLTVLVFSISALFIAFILFRRFRLNAIAPQRSALYLNRQLNQLEFSAELLLQDTATLSLPARLQRRRVEQEISRQAAVKPPVRLLDAGLWLLLSAMLALGFFTLGRSMLAETLPAPQEEEQLVSPADTVGTHRLEEQIPGLSSGRLRVAPPAYTGRKAWFSELANVRAPEGSRLTWQLAFDGQIQSVWISMPGEDSISFHHSQKGDYTAQLELKQNVLYQLMWETKTGSTGTTDYLKLEAIPDEMPQLQITQPEQYLRRERAAPFSVKMTAADDYGLTDAYLSLTISRGSGEGVKFREKKLWFDQDFSAQPRELALSLQIDPQALEMEPGDELYYYLRAFDNREPQRQSARTPTYFYKWIDTTAEASFEVSGLAMEVMPEYFRSQRQIIIDTEKLIEERVSISEAEFEKRSGNLGVDQKLLRLRYGKFLGEEFESDYGSGGRYEGEHGEHRHDPHEHDHDHDEEHDHNHDEEEHAHPDHGHDHDHAHAGEGGQERGGSNPLAGFMHAHDTEEGATFYEESVKVKLKAALAEMWEAELRLRTNRPQEALPYEYRALDIIKEVQQATRIYVERVGFEPPPIRVEEKRLTGALEAARSASRSSQREPADTLPAIRELIPLLQQKDREEMTELSRQELQLLKKAGDELALVVQQYPRNAYLKSLSLLREIMNDQHINSRQNKFLQRSLLDVLPKQLHEVKASTAYRNEMEKRFIEKIGGGNE